MIVLTPSSGPYRFQGAGSLAYVLRLRLQREALEPRGVLIINIPALCEMLGSCPRVRYRVRVDLLTECWPN